MKRGERTIGRPTNKHIGREAMKTAKMDLVIALAIGMTTLCLAGCGKPESAPTATAAAPAAQKPAAPSGAATEKAGEKPAEHGEGEALKLSAEAINIESAESRSAARGSGLAMAADTPKPAAKSTCTTTPDAARAPIANVASSTAPKKSAPRARATKVAGWLAEPSSMLPARSTSGSP